MFVEEKAEPRDSRLEAINVCPPSGEGQRSAFEFT